MKIEIGDREYNVTCARTEEERIKGLQGVTEMKDDEGKYIRWTGARPEMLRSRT